MKLIVDRTKALRVFLGAIGLTLVLQIPIVGLLVILLDMPLMLLVPSFASSGPHVTFWILGLILESPLAWAAFFVYHGLICAIPFGLLRFKFTQKKLGE